MKCFTITSDSRCSSLLTVISNGFSLVIQLFTLLSFVLSRFIAPFTGCVVGELFTLAFLRQFYIISRTKVSVLRAQKLASCSCKGMLAFSTGNGFRWCSTSEMLHYCTFKCCYGLFGFFIVFCLFFCLSLRKGLSLFIWLHFSLHTFLSLVLSFP